MSRGSVSDFVWLFPELMPAAAVSDLPASPTAARPALAAASSSILCDWCRRPLRHGQLRGRFCSRNCRQAAWRLRRLQPLSAAAAQPLRFAYADPPYPGMARRFYRHETSYAGEVDHAALIGRLNATYAGWALSTSAKALRDVLPLCPPEVRVAAWVKPIGVWASTFGIHNAWEPLLVQPGRSERPGKRDWLRAQPARGGGKLMGRKPLAFCAWLFGLLGMLPGDELDDLFPGTGIVSWAWAELARGGSALSESAASPADPGDTADH